VSACRVDHARKNEKAQRKLSLFMGRPLVKVGDPVRTAAQNDHCRNRPKKDDWHSCSPLSPYFLLSRVGK
jgi:hypothetical protein